MPLALRNAIWHRKQCHRIRWTHRTTQQQQIKNQVNVKNNGNATVVCVSGGVDSAVALHLVKTQAEAHGRAVSAVFMRNWDREDDDNDSNNTRVSNRGPECDERTWARVQAVCARIGVPVKEVALNAEYWSRVFEPSMRAYAAGRTPNPDIMCNKAVKFAWTSRPTFDISNNKHNFNGRVATGHYANKAQSEDGSWALYRARDATKDQTYFLAHISQRDLSRLEFPVGSLLKSEVKSIARHLCIPECAAAPESMGLCFVGDQRRKFSSLLQNHLGTNNGIVTNVNGQTIGEHQGQHFYTIGQRVRFSGLQTRHYVVGKDVERNVIVAAAKEEAEKLLYVNEFEIEAASMHWIAGNKPDLQKRMRMAVQVRHLGKAVRCELFPCDNRSCDGSNVSRRILVRTMEPQFAPAPGQYAVFYSGDECLGCAEIAAATYSRSVL